MKEPVRRRAPRTRTPSGTSWMLSCRPLSRDSSAWHRVVLRICEKSPLKPEMPGLSLNSDVNGRKPPTRLSNRSATFKFCPSSPCGLVNPITDQVDPTTLSTG